MTYYAYLMYHVSIIICNMYIIELQLKSFKNRHHNDFRVLQTQ